MVSASKKILYFGLDPSRYAYMGDLDHFPLIKTQSFPYEKVRSYFSVPHSHVLFTSRMAAAYYFQYTDEKDKIFICVGEATAARLADFGAKTAYVAKEACAEGVIALLETISFDHILYPHSAKARPLLPAYLRGKGTAFALYDTYPNTEALPDLAPYDKLVFTSPSTVNVFASMCTILPPRAKCEAIGPVTQNALNKFFDSSILGSNNP